MSKMFTEAQAYLAQIIAGHEAALAIDRHEPGMAGFLALYEANLPLDTKLMLAEYERVKQGVFAQSINRLEEIKQMMRLQNDPR
jgi:hypothetical protein